MSAFQWFNPAIWMLRADLQELHEYEADDAVLRSGANIKDYQYLLIRKAVGKSGYSVANSFNHSILKNRITMMSKSKSPLRRGLRVLYLLPLVCLGIGLQARTVYVPQDKDRKKDGTVSIVSTDGTDPLFVLRQAWGAQIGEEEIMVNSYHKRHVTENHIYQTVAYSEDGLIEAIEYPSDTFNIGVQWHPERMNDFDEPSQKLMEYFVNECSINKKEVKL